ncbi:FtsX-like permease family protein [Corynebacterium mycetoides]|uniref:FtsX-like permease family protein n=2 Tax=Corynebacterium mycetoides TaxID=38302 RepID=A0A1G9NH36_9CORY|nr:FtsX-like permease family protein [Corynebacterium mycetoides]
MALLMTVAASVALTVAAAAVGLTIKRTVDSIFALPYTGVGYVKEVRGETTNIPSGAVFDRTTTAHLLEEGNLYTTTPVSGITQGPLQWRGVIDGRMPEGPGEVAATGVTPAVGSTQTLLFGAEPVEVSVVGRVTPSAAEQLIGGAGLVADSAALDAWEPTETPVGEIRSAESFSGAIPAAQHVQDLSDTYFDSRNKYFLLLAAFTLVVAVVAALTIFSSSSVIAGARVREMGLIRAVGGSSASLLLSAGIEALVIGLIGVAAGLPTGIALADVASELAQQLGIRVPLDDVGLPEVWLAAIGAAAVAVTVVSAVPASMTAVRKSATDSVSGAGSGNGRYVYAALALAFAGAAWFVRGGGVIRAVASAGFVVLACAAAAAVVIPMVLRVPVALPRFGLALGYAARQWSRSAAVIGIVVAAVALVSAVLAGSAQLRAHFVNVAEGQGVVDVGVTSLTGDVEPSLVDALSAVPGVEASAVPPRVSEGFALEPASPVLRRPLEQGVVNLGRGASVDTELPVRETSNSVTLVDPAVVPEQLPNAPAPTVFLRMSGEPVQDQSVLDGVRAVAAGAAVPVTMSESFSRRVDTVAMVERLLSITRLMSVVALLIAAVGIANTVFLSWRERARDRELLNSLGLTPAGSAGVMAVELLLLAIPAAVVGWLIGQWAGIYIAGVAIE